MNFTVAAVGLFRGVPRVSGDRQGAGDASRDWALTPVGVFAAGVDMDEGFVKS